LQSYLRWLFYCSASIPLRIVNPIDSNAEWIEVDGLGGFASGTVSGIRSLRFSVIVDLERTAPWSCEHLSVSDKIDTPEVIGAGETVRKSIAA
jgi:hypothetical protein